VSYKEGLNCIAWRRGVRKVWRLPNTTHSSLLPGIINTMPLIDLLYRRFLKFVYRCLSSWSFVLNFIARHSILFCCMNSIVGRNVLSCCQCYSTNIDNVIAFRFNIEIIDHIANTASDDVCNCMTMLNELLQCRDGMLCLSDNSFSSNDVEQLISFLCTSLPHFFKLFFFLFWVYFECKLILCLHVTCTKCTK